MDKWQVSFADRVHRGAWLGIAILSAAFAHVATAQGVTGTPGEELPRYTVELIVFTYSDSSATGEIFVPELPATDDYLPAELQRHPADTVPVFGDRPVEEFDEARPEGEPAEVLQPAIDEKQATTEPAEITGIDQNLQDIPLRARIELLLLSPEQYTMDEIYAKLVELDAYHPIMRTAWTQTTPAQDAAPAIQLRALGEAPPGLDGSVKLYQGRFVHLGIDLALDAEEPAATAGIAGERRTATDRAIAYGDAAVGNDGDAGAAYDPSRGAGPVYSDRGDGARGYEDSGSPFAAPVRYRISEVRIMKDGDIRYYDHPRFGVIAKLTEVPDEEERDASAADPLAAD